MVNLSIDNKLLYIFPDDVAHDLIYINSRYICSKLLMTLLSNLPMKGDILLKNHVSCNFMLKCYIPVTPRQFTKTLNQFFYLSRAN